MTELRIKKCLERAKKINADLHEFMDILRKHEEEFDREIQTSSPEKATQLLLHFSDLVAAVNQVVGVEAKRLGALRKRVDKIVKSVTGPGIDLQARGAAEKDD